jgi:aspartate-semialdehyde dehydrogenase
MTENGYNEEEMKMVKETHKIWGEPDVAITATCIRVPVMRAHAESINLELAREMSEEEVRAQVSRPDQAPLPGSACLDADCRAPYKEAQRTLTNDDDGRGFAVLLRLQLT